VYNVGYASLSSSSSSLSMLLNLYMQGQISEQLWQRMMRLFDDEATSKTERMALVRYVRDVVSEDGSDSQYMPRAKDLSEVLSHVRHA
jgi:hypothetical protein